MTYKSNFYWVSNSTSDFSYRARIFDTKWSDLIQDTKKAQEAMKAQDQIRRHY